MLGGLAGCGPRAASPAPAPKVTTYEVRGVLREAAPERRSARISHEAIPGYMEAMTMEFDVRDARELEGLKPGDPILFQLAVTEAHGWIEMVRKLPGAAPLVPAVAAPAGRSEGVPPLEPGAMLPDCDLIDERGHRFSLRELQGETLAVTFIYTRCPFPDFCPKLSRKFEEAQRELSASGDGKWRLLSITIDPEYDMPERLAAYARQFEAVPSRWTFATGSLEDLRRLAAACGVSIREGNGPRDHTLRTLVVDAEGKVRRVFPGNAWTPGEIVAAIKSASAPVP